jgi:aryl-alcohol dehydrogenase-like predicted oxidoreductase
MAPSTTDRVRYDKTAARLYTATEEADEKVVNALTEVAGARNVPRAQVALAWLMQQRDVTAPIVGATKLGHLDDAVEAMRLKLDPSEIELLGRHYVPHAMSFAE